MRDQFSGRETCIHGHKLPGEREQAAVLDGHRRRLRTFDRLGEAATQCDLRTDQDRDLVLLEIDEVSLLEQLGGAWVAFGGAIREFRAELPLLSLEAFGFEPREVEPGRLHRIGGGVEALAFAADDGSVYKFFLFRRGGGVGATFDFSIEDTGV